MGERVRAWRCDRGLSRADLAGLFLCDMGLRTPLLLEPLADIAQGLQQGCQPIVAFAALQNAKQMTTVRWAN